MDEEARQLREDNSRLKAELKQKEDRIGKLEGLLMAALPRREELERRLGKDSHNSSKPPLQPRSRTWPQRKHERSEKHPGGQPGHQGHHLARVDEPDRVIEHRSQQCSTCHQDLRLVIGFMTRISRIIIGFLLIGAGLTLWFLFREPQLLLICTALIGVGLVLVGISMYSISREKQRAITQALQAQTETSQPQQSYASQQHASDSPENP